MDEGLLANARQNFQSQVYSNVSDKVYPFLVNLNNQIRSELTLKYIAPNKFEYIDDQNRIAFEISINTFVAYSTKLYYRIELYIANFGKRVLQDQIVVFEDIYEIKDIEKAINDVCEKIKVVLIENKIVTSN